MGFLLRLFAGLTFLGIFIGTIVQICVKIVEAKRKGKNIFKEEVDLTFGQKVVLVLGLFMLIMLSICGAIYLWK